MKWDPLFKQIITKSTSFFWQPVEYPLKIQQQNER
jgi:hypothetical protein